MKIKKEQVWHIAHLARLGLSEKEIERFQKELSSILDYVELLKEIDVSKVKPTFHPTEDFLKKEKRVMRKDKAISQPEKKTNKLIELAPEKKGRYIKVKTIL